MTRATVFRALQAPGLAFVFAVCCALPAGAQVWIGRGSGAPRAGSVEVGGGLQWSQGYDLATVPAVLTRNPSTGSSPFPFFSAETHLDGPPGALGRIGVYLSRSVSVEGGFQYSRPVLSVRLSGDTEEAAPITASETITRYIFDGSLVLHLTGLSFAGGRGIPFVMGGAGYLRELHAGRELVETGTQFHAGGGVKVWFSATRQRLGIRGEVAVAVRDGGFDFEEGSRRVPVAGVSLVYLF